MESNSFLHDSWKNPPNGNPPSGKYGNADYSTILDGQGLYVTRSDDDYYGTFLLKITYVLIMEKMELILTDQMVVQL